MHKERSSAITRKNTKEVAKPNNVFLSNQILSTSPRGTVADGYQSNLQNPRQIALESAPNSLMSSPSRSPRIICPDQIPTSAFWAVKPHTDVTFLGSGQCSSPGSGQTSGHNSVGGDMLGPIFWQPSRGSPECSPIPSPRMTSPGPSSRVHSGSVSPLHPRAGGVTPESPTNRHAEGNKKQTHRLPLPPLSIANSSTFLPNSSTPASPISRSPGRTENPPSPGSRWKKGKLIGRGTFGHVYAGFNRYAFCHFHAWKWIIFTSVCMLIEDTVFCKFTWAVYQSFSFCRLAVNQILYVEFLMFSSWLLILADMF